MLKKQKIFSPEIRNWANILLLSSKMNCMISYPDIWLWPSIPLPSPTLEIGIILSVKKILEKLFDKMGISKKATITGQTLTASFSISAATKKGARTINFTYSVSNYGWGDISFGASEH